uniref:FYVE-type domain-containing protein n=1 Tax=Peronospora matthiolae TaxID=2874970 RepID=A0AAV1T6J1_9STRA
MHDRRSSSSSTDLDLTYMPYHEGLLNHNAPPVRGSLSVRVPSRQQHQLHPLHDLQQSPFYGDSDDDDVSDDPAWMNAPRGSLQPAFSSSMMKKASSVSVTDSQTSSLASVSTDRIGSAGEDDEQEKLQSTDGEDGEHDDGEDEEDDDDDVLPSRVVSTMQSPTCREAPLQCKNSASTSSGRSLNNADGTSMTGVELDKCTTVSTDNIPVDATTADTKVVPSNSTDTSETDQETKVSDSSSDGDLPPSLGLADGSDRFRESLMRYRPSNLKPQDVRTALLSRDSLAPENFELTGCSTDLCRGSNMGSSVELAARDGRTSDGVERSPIVDLMASTRITNCMNKRDSVKHFGPRVTEEGLSDYLRAAKSGNLPLLRNCLQERSTNLAERDPVHGQSAMHLAVRFGQLHAVQLLCGKKTRSLLIDAVDTRQNTPLHLAAAKSRRITKYLLEHGADASRVNNRNQTALAVQIITTKRDDPLIAEMLLQHKTDPNSPLGNSTLLHKAVDLKLFEIAYRLVRHGARLDAKDAQGRTVFEKAEPTILRQLCGKIAYPPVWIPNVARKSCMSCERHFSHLNIGVRRHHCRHCGRLVCGRCSHVSVESEAFPRTFIGHIDRTMSEERSTLKRVCTTCSSVFDERARQGKEGCGDSSGRWSDAFMERVVGCAWDEIERKGSSSSSSGNSPGSSRLRGSLAT